MTTLKGIFPESKPTRRKNFIHENVKSLRRMEQCFHTNKEMEELQKLQLHRHHKFAEKYQNVTARVNSSFRDKKYEENNTETNVISNDIQDGDQHLCRKSSAPTIIKNMNPIQKVLGSFTNDNASMNQKRGELKSSNNHMQKLQGKVLSDPSFLHKHSKKREKQVKAKSNNFQSKGIQTLDTSDIDSLYSEGMIRYPSKKCLKGIEPIKRNEMQQIDEVSTKASSPPSDRGDIELPQSVCRKSSSRSPDLHVTKEEVDFVKLNKERTSVASRMVAQLTQNTAAPPNYRKGVVPKYIRERKEAYEKEQKAKAEAADSDCPDGHVPLPDSERKETLRMLKKNYQDYVNELNKMPIKTDTLKAQRRKIEIEKQLTKLEEGIKVFSRPKVYVKINA